MTSTLVLHHIVRSAISCYALTLAERLASMRLAVITLIIVITVVTVLLVAARTFIVYAVSVCLMSVNTTFARRRCPIQCNLECL